MGAHFSFPKLQKSFFIPLKRIKIIIKNVAYDLLCLFYKREITSAKLEKNLLECPGSDRIKYGIANWHFYNAEKEISKRKIETVGHAKKLEFFWPYRS